MLAGSCIMLIMQLVNKKKDVNIHNCIECLNDIIKFEKSTNDALFNFIILNFPLAR